MKYKLENKICKGFLKVSYKEKLICLSCQKIKKVKRLTMCVKNLPFIPDSPLDCFCPKCKSKLESLYNVHHCSTCGKWEKMKI